MHVGVLAEPSLHGGGLMGREVIQDHVNLLTRVGIIMISSSCAPAGWRWCWPTSRARGYSPQPAGENLGKQAGGKARCLKNRMGNGSSCGLTPSGRHKLGCHGALMSGVRNWGCKRAGGCIVMWLEMPKWKFQLNRQTEEART